MGPLLTFIVHPHDAWSRSVSSVGHPHTPLHETLLDTAEAPLDPRGTSARSPSSTDRLPAESSIITSVRGTEVPPSFHRERTRRTRGSIPSIASRANGKRGLRRRGPRRTRAGGSIPRRRTAAARTSPTRHRRPTRRRPERCIARRRLSTRRRRVERGVVHPAVQAAAEASSRLRPDMLDVRGLPC